jgi:hypothetical protein
MRLASTRTLRREIDEAVLAGQSIAQIEAEVIAPCALDAEASAALWLYADGSLARAAAGHLPAIPDTGVTGPAAPI